MMSHSTQRARAPSARSWVLIAVIAAALFATACGPVYVQDQGYAGYNNTYQGSYQTGVVASGQVDFSYLTAYGFWTNSARFGRVWVPNANRTPGWRPYFYGRWDYSDYGWTWASDEPWGWGPYHYGRWAWDNQYRWVWIPGYVWGPAWVTWRTGGSYIGWAPLGPRGYVYNHATYWTFIDRRYIYRRPVHTVIIHPSQVSVVYRQTRRIHHVGRIRTRSGRVVVYNAGPRRSTVQTWTRTPIQTRRVTNIRSAVPRRTPAVRGRRGAYRPPARGRTYRPAPSRTYRPTGRVAPTRTRSPAAYRPAPSRGYRAAPQRGYQPPARGRTYQPPSRGRAYQPPARGRSYRPAPSRGYRPAPSRGYRPAPSRAAPSRGRAAPGRAAPGYGRSANPYRAAPRARSSSGRSSSRSSGRSSRSTRSSRSRAAPSRGRSSGHGRATRSSR